MHIVDISLPLQEGMAIYPGDPPFRTERVARVDPQDPGSWNLSRLSMGTHTGTHVDPPRHFDEDGPGADALSLDVLCGPAKVVDLREAGPHIGVETIDALDLAGIERLLLRTVGKESLDGPFDANHAHVSEDAVHLLRHRGVRLIGIDTPSIEAFDSPGMPVHHALLRRHPALMVLEGLDLRAAEAGEYTLFCLPLKIVHGDGAPARAILVW